MPEARLNISFVWKRMLKQSEAAEYTGLPVAKFKAVCPIRPIKMGRGSVLWDRHDLDNWIDALKGGGGMMTHEAIISRLE